MRIAARPSFLTLTTDASSLKHSVKISSTFDKAIERWTAGTRLSPIWGFAEFQNTEPGDVDFAGESSLVFIGPIAPARLMADVATASRQGAFSVWTSVGFLSLVIRVPGSEREPALAELLAWGRKSRLVFEHWRVIDGIIKPVEANVVPTRDASQSVQAVARLAKEVDSLSLRPAMQEYCALMASAISRAAMMSAQLFDELVVVNEWMAGVIDENRKGKLPMLDTQSTLLSMNAALSRFSSQAFSGIPPVLGTECHFWTHSLLGTGSANVALARLASYVQSTLGEARLPERIASLVNRKDNVPTLDQLTTSPELLSADYLKDAAVDGSDPVLPLVTYFSGRDGFSSHVQTLSAPLTTIAECNSFRSNLLTITHELSHIFVQGVLSEIYPDHTDSAEVHKAWQMTRPQFRAGNWLEAAQQLLIEGLLSMEQATRGRDLQVDSINEAVIVEVLRDWRREAQEILVHTFDFMYFYGSESASYLEGIWHSWCAIPGIGDRVREYILRSLCAISSQLLKEEPKRRAAAAVRELQEAFERLQGSGEVASNYVGEADAYLKANWETADKSKSMLEAYRARIYLVRLVATFLHSEAIAATLFRDPLVGGGAGTGYAKTRSIYDLAPVGNPLRFLREQLKASPSEAESLWVLHNLAFNAS